MILVESETHLSLPAAIQEALLVSMLSVAARCEGGNFDDVVDQIEEFGGRSGRHIRFVSSITSTSKPSLILTALALTLAM